MEQSPFKGKRGLARLWHALRYSFAGLRAALRHEHAFRQEAALALVLIPAAFVLADGGLARAALIGSVLLLLIVELLNSAIEAVVDRVSLEHHHLAGRAKDFGSAAVLVALLNVATVWACVLLWP